MKDKFWMKNDNIYFKNKLVSHKKYIEKHGQDMPEILNWKWNQKMT